LRGLNEILSSISRMQATAVHPEGYLATRQDGPQRCY